MKKHLVIALALLVTTVGTLLTCKSVGSAARDKEILDMALKAVGASESYANAARVYDPVEAKEIGFPSPLARVPQQMRAVTVDFPSVEIWQVGRPFDITVFVSEHNGLLLKAIVQPSDADSIPLALLTPEDQRMFSRGWCFKDFPDSQYVSLLEVLRACPMGPRSAKRIVTLYVLDSCVAPSELRGAIQPKWVTVLTGHTPYPAKGIQQVPDSILDKGPTSAIVTQDGLTGAPLTAWTY